MASEPLSMTDDHGLPIRFGTTQLGAVGVNVRAGMTAILLSLSGGKQDEFARLFSEQCRRANGEPPATEARSDGFRDYTCGACGLTHETNGPDDDVQCPDCEARRCPNCKGWYGGDHG